MLRFYSVKEIEIIYFFIIGIWLKIVVTLFIWLFHTIFLKKYEPFVCPSSFLFSLFLFEDNCVINFGIKWMWVCSKSVGLSVRPSVCLYFIIKFSYSFVQVVFQLPTFREIYYSSILFYLPSFFLIFLIFLFFLCSLHKQKNTSD